MNKDFLAFYLILSRIGCNQTRQFFLERFIPSVGLRDDLNRILDTARTDRLCCIFLPKLNWILRLVDTILMAFPLLTLFGLEKKTASPIFIISQSIVGNPGPLSLTFYHLAIDSFLSQFRYKDVKETFASEQ